jgi:hypothetical protein
MSLRRLPLAATLSVLAMTLAAEDYTGGVSDAVPGRIVDGGRKIYLTGLVDLDGLKGNNLTDGNSNRSDMRSDGWGRAELGTRVVLDEKLEVGVAVGYVSKAGSNVPLGYNEDGTNIGVNDPNANASNGYHNSGDVTLEDAFVHLPNFLGFRALSVLAGRQQVSWNLRKGRTAWLYDSRAQNRAVTRWDGVQVKFDFDSWNMDFAAYAFRLPDNSSLFGGMGDWKVIDKGDTQFFITGSYSYQKNPQVSKNQVYMPVPTSTDTGTMAADNLRTAYVGLDLDLSSVEFYGEFAMQRGDVGDSQSSTFHGWGANAGIDWRLVKTRSQEFILGGQYEYLSGDDDTNDGQYNGFVNTWEATSDTYMFEHEKYGQITRLVVGNLTDTKVRLEYSVLRRIRMSGIWGNYRLVNPPAGGSAGLGNEFDGTISWDYAGTATSAGLAGGCTFTLFGGILKPSSGFEELQATRTGDPTFASTDMMWQLGINVLSRF